ncbi:hypothetical protein RBSWK_05913 [Rhodopirellula baltica SWK14]|uniref:Uncharacterized protein n=1 Tax=Rhodopirellula baltica SWK14 TaxID=993516 RepID=L7C8K6_RHOBT|nr:hypothetical protein RBSWK_05913 [Rhodopirellula baltica SWK14]
MVNSHLAKCPRDRVKRQALAQDDSVQELEATTFEIRQQSKVAGHHVAENNG